MKSAPLERSYWVEEPQFLAGVYAGEPDGAGTKAKLRCLLGAGIRSFCNLTEPRDGLRNYEGDLAQVAREMGVDARLKRFGIRDIGTTTPEHMMEILDWIDGEIARGRPVYVHCWGGIGRTGMVVGCWLVRHGKATGDAALRLLEELRSNSTDAGRKSPETDDQCDIVREWHTHEAGRRRGAPQAPGTLSPGALAPGALERAQGCLLGQLAGDALGSLVEFKGPEEIRALYPRGVRDLADGGTWNTIAGQPTDDSEMALALARTILRQGGYDAEEALRAYQEWLHSRPFDAGNTIKGSLRGHKSPGSQANGAMMRVSPLGIFAARYPRSAAADWARADAELTHINPVCLEANALFTMAIAEAVASGPAPEELWETVDAWARELEVDSSLTDAVEASRTARPHDYVSQAGWVMIAFQNALYQLLHAPNLEEGVVDTVMQGGDTDTNAAICGALLGAVYGVDAVPERWRSTVLACRPEAGRPGVVHPRPQEYWPVDALEVAAGLVGVAKDDGIDLGKISPEGIARLVSFLPELTPTGDGRLKDSPEADAGRGFLESPPLPKAAVEFMQACYDEGFVQSFDWMAWGNTRPPELRSDATLEDADLRTIVKLLTFHMRADRFDVGHLHEALSQGAIEKILRRLSEIFRGGGAGR
jgi:ADP-ribosyl-[dinitrogen reductase] hydrolase